MANNIKTISDASFEADVLKSDKPVLVDFWAEWCGPCKMIAPIVDEVASEYAGKVNFTKMDVDSNPATLQNLAFVAFRHCFCLKMALLFLKK